MNYELPKGFEKRVEIYPPYGIRRGRTVYFFDEEFRKDDIEKYGYKVLPWSTKPSLEELGTFDTRLWGYTLKGDLTEIPTGDIIVIKVKDPEEVISNTFYLFREDVEELFKDENYLEGIFLKSFIDDVPYPSRFRRAFSREPLGKYLKILYKPVELIEGGMLRPSPSLISLQLLTSNIEKITCCNVKKEF